MAVKSIRDCKELLGSTPEMTLNNSIPFNFAGLGQIFANTNANAASNSPSIPPPQFSNPTLDIFSAVQQRQASALAAWLLLNGLGQGPSMPPMPAVAPIQPQGIVDFEPIFTVEDEKIIVRKLVEGVGKQSHFEILQKLDKKNGHSVSEWTTFYLKNIEKINSLVSEHNKPPPARTSSTGPPRLKSESRSQPTRVCTISPPDKGVPITHPSKPVSFRSNSSSKDAVRLRRNESLSKQSSKSDIKRIRSPTPPKNIIAKGAGYLYTAEDVEFFRKTLSNWLEEHPGDQPIPQNRLAKKLAMKTPHHSAASWRSWMSYNKKPQEIMKAMSREFCKYSCRRRTRTRQTSNDERASGSEPFTSAAEDDCSDRAHVFDGESEPEYHPGLISSGDETDELPVLEDDFLKTPYRSNRFLPEEKKAIAKYVASLSLDRWDYMPRLELLRKFQPQYPRHSLKSWTQYCRKHENEIRSQARKYIAREKLRRIQTLTPSNSEKLLDATTSSSE